ncbi:MAG: pyridinium-3,5-bisthiocarboxylic acid mononucleotide nickel chelatase [Acidobacteriota bacterium]|nr:pyridinium-3,5-bisthiocarboxylic acid mononucleotide nickel chelatase [Acidobacteriota bacterium]
MILGALVGVGVDPHALTEALTLLNVSGYEINFETVDRSGISATRAHVSTAHEHAHRHLGDILKIIYDSRLSDKVKERAARIFSRLAEAEARVHNVPVERIHFHEVGALDAIIDVVGACIGFELLGVERFICSALHVGSGTVEMAHGRFPVPPPAVAEILRDAPIYSSNIVGELVTPTGAAIISTVCREFGALPMMKIERTGYGAGKREYQNFPNVLRLMIGEDGGVEASGDERLVVVETNIDDMSPQIYGHIMDEALKQGALDCYFAPVQMKKNRPGVLISILCRPHERDAMCELLLTETTTLGVRFYEVLRRALEREMVKVETEFGPIDVKVAHLDGRVVKEMPEYEQCRAAAAKANVPLQTVEQAARDSFVKLRSKM